MRLQECRKDCRRKRGRRGRRWRREKRWKGINDTKTAIPTFRPCTALRSRIREYRVRAFDTEKKGGRFSSFTLLHANRPRGEEEGIDGKQDPGRSRRRLRHVNEGRILGEGEREERRHADTLRVKRGVNAIMCNYVSRGCSYTVALYVLAIEKSRGMIDSTNEANATRKRITRDGGFINLYYEETHLLSRRTSRQSLTQFCIGEETVSLRGCPGSPLINDPCERLHSAVCGAAKKKKDENAGYRG